jgi:hypothetical protein
VSPRSRAGAELAQTRDRLCVGRLQRVEEAGGLFLCEHNVPLISENFFGPDASGPSDKVAQRLADGGCRGNVERALVVGQAEFQGLGTHRPSVRRGQTRRVTGQSRPRRRKQQLFSSDASTQGPTASALARERTRNRLTVGRSVGVGKRYVAKGMARVAATPVIAFVASRSRAAYDRRRLLRVDAVTWRRARAERKRSPAIRVPSRLVCTTRVSELGSARRTVRYRGQKRRGRRADTVIALPAGTREAGLSGTLPSGPSSVRSIIGIERALLSVSPALATAVVDSPIAGATRARCVLPSGAVVVGHTATAFLYRRAIGSSEAVSEARAKPNPATPRSEPSLSDALGCPGNRNRPRVARTLHRGLQRARRPVLWAKTPEEVLAKAIKRRDTSDPLH